MATVITQSLAYPIRFENGGLATAPYPSVGVAQYIQQFCETMARERVLRQTYGLPDLVFRSVQDLQAVEAVILSNLTVWFPQVRFTVAARLVKGRHGTIAIEVKWALLPTFFRSLDELREAIEREFIIAGVGLANDSRNSAIDGSLVGTQNNFSNQGSSPSLTRSSLPRTFNDAIRAGMFQGTIDYQIDM